MHFYHHQTGWTGYMYIVHILKGQVHILPYGCIRVYSAIWMYVYVYVMYVHHIPFTYNMPILNPESVKWCTERIHNFTCTYSLNASVFFFFVRIFTIFFVHFLNTFVNTWKWSWTYSSLRRIENFSKQKFCGNDRCHIFFLIWSSVFRYWFLIWV